jgi:hypothetical protein
MARYCYSLRLSSAGIGRDIEATTRVDSIRLESALHQIKRACSAWTSCCYRASEAGAMLKQRGTDWMRAGQIDLGLGLPLSMEYAFSTRYAGMRTVRQTQRAGSAGARLGHGASEAGAMLKQRGTDWMGTGQSDLRLHARGCCANGAFKELCFCTLRADLAMDQLRVGIDPDVIAAERRNFLGDFLPVLDGLLRDFNIAL